MAGLTPKQEKFAQSVAHKEFDYIWEAYAAHYSTSTMSKNTMYQESCRLLANPKVSARVAKIEKEIAEKSTASLEEILNFMTARVRIDIREFFEEDGSFKKINDLTKEQASCLGGFDVQEIWAGTGKDRTQIGELKKVKIIDVEKIMDMFMKNFGAYVTKLKVDTEDLSHIEDLISGIKR